MRISVIGKQYPDSLAKNISFTLRQMGHDVQDVEQGNIVNFFAVKRFRQLFSLIQQHPRYSIIESKQIAHSLIRYKPDIVLNTYANLHPNAIALTRSALGISTKILFLYPDATANLGREYSLASDYDLWFFKDPFSVDLFRTHLGMNVHYLPEACNPAWHYQVELTNNDLERYSCDLATAGNMYYYRARILEMFNDYDIKIWGSSFPAWLNSPLRDHYSGLYVAEIEKAKALRSAKIVLNTLSHKEVCGVNARTFEVAGCGAFQIADWRPTMEEMFKPDKELVTFRSRDELKDKVDYYLQRPEAREVIAIAGCRRAHSEHTYQKRLEKVLELAYDN